MTGPVAGATISLARLPLQADYVPAKAELVAIGHVGSQVNLKVPDVDAGLYEAVVSCAQCSTTGAGSNGLYPAGSILVAASSKSSTTALIVNYVILALVLFAVALGIRSRRRRRAQGLGRRNSEWGRLLGGMLLGQNAAATRRGTGWDEDVPPRGGRGGAAGGPNAGANGQGGRGAGSKTAGIPFDFEAGQAQDSGPARREWARSWQQAGCRLEHWRLVDGAHDEAHSTLGPS